MAPLKAFLEDATGETSASHSGPSAFRDGGYMGHICGYEGCPKLALGSGKSCITHNKQSQIANSGLPNDMLNTRSTCSSGSYPAPGTQMFSAFHPSNGTKMTPNQDTLNPKRVTMTDSQLQESPGTPGKKLSAKNTARKTAQVPQKVHITTGISQASTRLGSFASNAPRGEPLARLISAQPPLKRQRTSEDVDQIHKRHQSTVQAPFFTEGISSSGDPNSYSSQNSKSSYPPRPGMSVQTDGQNQNHGGVNGQLANELIPRAVESDGSFEAKALPQLVQHLDGREQSFQPQIRCAECDENSTSPICKPTVVQPSAQTIHDQLPTPNIRSNNNYERITMTPTTNGVHSPSGLKEAETRSYQQHLTKEGQSQQIPSEKSFLDRSQSVIVQQTEQAHSTPHSRPLESVSSRLKTSSIDKNQTFFSAVLNTDYISDASRNPDMPPYPTPPPLQRPESSPADATGFQPSSRSETDSVGQPTNGFGFSSSAPRREETSQRPQELSPWMKKWRQKNQITRESLSKSPGSGMRPWDRSGKPSQQVSLPGNSGSRASNPTPPRQSAPHPAMPVIIDLISDDEESAHEPDIYQHTQRAVHTVSDSTLHLKDSGITSTQRWAPECSIEGSLPVSNDAANKHNAPEYKQQPPCASEASITPYPWVFAAQTPNTNLPSSKGQTIAKEGSVDMAPGRSDLVSEQVSDGLQAHVQHDKHHRQQQCPAPSSVRDGSSTHRPSNATMSSVLPQAAGSIPTTLPVPENTRLVDSAEIPAVTLYHNHHLPYNHQQETKPKPKPKPRGRPKQHGSALLIANAHGSQDNTIKDPEPQVHRQATPATAKAGRDPTFSERRRVYRHGKFIFSRHGEAALDKYVYGPANDQNRPGSSSYGLPPDTMSTRPEKPVEHWAHFDPRVHWTWSRTQEWHESKMKEIAARPSRKARLLLNKSKAGATHIPIEPPEIVQNNPHWLACLKEFDQLAELGLAHQESLKVQGKDSAEAVFSRINVNNGEDSGDDNISSQ